jgi:hypothetical protein
MTACDAISRTDSLMPNAYTKEQKVKWLSACDGQIFAEIINTHADAPTDTFTEYTDDTPTLIVPAPYDYDVYINYLEAMIAKENSEIDKFNNNIAIYNSAIISFSNKYNREHLPKQTGTHFKF